MIQFPNDFVIIPFILTFLVTALITPGCIVLSKKIGLIDDPKRHKHPALLHTRPIPRGGGLPLLLSVFLVGIFFLPINQTTIAVFAAALLALIVGLVDDRLNAKSKDVSPYLRFFLNIVVAIIVVANGVSIQFITNPFGGILHIPVIISFIISVVWLIWIMNMLNWSKGVDGQMPGIVAISAIVIGILSLRGTGEFIDAKLAFIIAGSALGFLLFNFHPAKLFPGYGATALYLLLGVTSMLSSAKLATALLVMGVPLVDFVFTILRRVIQKKSPFKGDKKHLHHLLLQLGWSQRQIALFYWGISAILGVLALSLESKSKVFAIIMVGVITGGGLFFLHAVTKKTNEKSIS